MRKKKQIYRLNYATVGKPDIDITEFDTLKELIDVIIPPEGTFFHEEWGVPRNTVFLFTSDRLGDDGQSELFPAHTIIIDDDYGYICQYIHFLKGYDEMDDCTDFFIFEFKSYEEAYKVALQMRETHALCYDVTFYKN